MAWISHGSRERNARIKWVVGSIGQLIAVQYTFPFVFIFYLFAYESSSAITFTCVFTPYSIYSCPSQDAS